MRSAPPSGPSGRARLFRAFILRVVQPDSWCGRLLVWLALLGLRGLVLYLRGRRALQRWAVRRMLRRLGVPSVTWETPDEQPSSVNS